MALRKWENTGNSQRSTRLHSLENSLWRGHGPIVILHDDDDDGGGGWRWLWQLWWWGGGGDLPN